MAESGPEQALDVVRRDIVPAFEGGGRLGGEEQHDLGPGAGSKKEFGGLASGDSQLDDVAPDLLVDGDRPDLLLAFGDGRGVQHRLQPGGDRILELDAPVPPVDDLQLLLRGGVIEHHLEEEAVLLRLRQRIGALVLDRVLGRQHQEGIGQPDLLAFEAHPALLHRLEQRRLDLGGRAVDLVCEEDVGEDRSLTDAEGP